MKNVLLIFALFISAVQLVAQENDPDLFQTWYLYEMEFEIDPPVVIEGWDPYDDPEFPQINPEITFEESLNFSGFGICNTFEGTLETANANCFPTVLSMTNTDVDCGLYEDELEGNYFSFFAPDLASICYTISLDDDGFQTLTLTGSIFSTYTFRNVEILNTPENRIVNFSVLPNPTTESLTIDSNNSIPIDSVTIYSLSGARLIAQDYHDISLDVKVNVSTLVSGMYFLEISSEGNKLIQKFIKN